MEGFRRRRGRCDYSDIMFRFIFLDELVKSANEEGKESIVLLRDGLRKDTGLSVNCELFEIIIVDV